MTAPAERPRREEKRREGLDIVQGLVVLGQKLPFQQLHIEPYTRPISREFVPRRTVAIAKYLPDPSALQFYAENGFGALPPIKRADAIAMGDELEEAIRRNNQNVQWGKDKGQAGTVLALEGPEKFSDTVADWVHDPRFLVPAALLVHGNPVWHHAKAFIKPEGEGGNFPPHTDDSFYPHRTRQIAAETLNLADITPAMGPVIAFSGTHLLADLAPTLGLPEDPHFPSEDWTEETAAQLGIPVGRFDGDAGTRNIHNARVVHRSAPNEGDRARRTLIVQFRAESNTPDLSRVRPDFLATGGVNRARYPEEGTVLARLAS